MRFLFKYPSRGRPDWFRETLVRWYRNLSGVHPFQFRITMDEDDASMNNPAMRNWLNNQKHLHYHYGTHRNKIQACNADIPDEGWDILVLVSDDMTPIAQGVDDIMAQDMGKHFFDGDGILHYFDGNTRDVMTLSVMGRKFWQRMGFVYWPAYQGTWCDNDVTDYARQEGKYWFCDRTIIRHDWRQHKQYGGDATYQKGEASYQQDRAVYEWRKARRFPMSYSQSNEDWVIRRYFKDQFDGRFLDIGAADGVTFSNTKVLYDMGWNGVAVEPSPNLASACRENCGYDRVVVVQAALTEKDGPAELWHTPDMTSTLSETHRTKWENTTPYRKIGVDGMTWKTLLAKYGCDFDFLNLDIEGQNMQRIKEIPAPYLERLKAACVEYDDGLCAVQEVFARFGFKTLQVNGENVIMGK